MPSIAEQGIDGVGHYETSGYAEYIAEEFNYYYIGYPIEYLTAIFFLIITAISMNKLLFNKIELAIKIQKKRIITIRPLEKKVMRQEIIHKLKLYYHFWSAVIISIYTTSDIWTIIIVGQWLLMFLYFFV